jgi:hypothetical protein
MSGIVVIYEHVMARADKDGNQAEQGGSLSELQDNVQATLASL